MIISYLPSPLASLASASCSRKGVILRGVAHGVVCGSSHLLSRAGKFYKSQRNVILCVTACLLYWCIQRICKYNKEIQSLEEIEKRYKDE